MILRLLKKLRITRRTHQQAISYSPEIGRGEGRDFRAPAQTALASLFPAIGSAVIKPLAVTGLALSLFSLPAAQAQQFQTPNLPGPGPAGIDQNLQSRIAHDQALKMQMLRAQKEQGAGYEFANKAYQAQQAYQTELAFQEYQAYLKKQEKDQQAQFLESSNAPRAKRLPARSAANNPNNPSTFTPPVHVAPVAVSASLGDEPRHNEYEHVNQYSNSREPIGTGVLQQAAYQQPAPSRQPAYQQNARQQHASPQRPASTYQRPPIQRTSYQVPQPQQRQNNVPRVQQPMPQRQPITQRQPTTQPQASYAPPRAKPREYIIEENSIGIQDRIASLLSKPRYRDISEPQPDFAQPRDAQRLTSAATQTMRGPRRDKRPRQPLYAPQATRQPLAQTRTPRRKSVNVSPKNVRANKIRRDLEVQQAFEMQQRMPGNRQAPSVRQVAMVEPLQDPFNDFSSSAPVMNAPTASQFNAPSAPEMLSPRAVQPTTPIRDQTPARQISILSSQEGESQDNQFGGGFQRPEPDLSVDRPLANQSDEDLDKLDAELNRRLKELESRSQEQPAEPRRIDSGNIAEDPQSDEPSRVQDMVDQLENELRQNRDEEEGNSIVDQDSMLDDDLDDEDTTKTIEKTCDEFRGDLLNSSIRDIALDMSPLASKNRDQYIAISRTWTDRSGNIVATGTMVDLRRGYVIIDGNGRQKIPYAKLSDADLAAVSQYWRLPNLCTVGSEGYVHRSWAPQTYTWKASSLCHKPLFFENIQLERYGHTHGPFTQPVHSIGHFFVSLVTVPYQSAMTPANECQYALGFYRPGNCAPWLKDPVPFSLDGAKRQAVIATGAAFIP